ncbi:MAG: N-acetyltransferase [Deltaproteobacteria bacterium]|nr:N-acetyltransferase [Deltaproteobacteria bacterium]
MEEGQVNVQRPYPRAVTLENNATLNLRLMTPADSHRIVTFARSLPEDDLLFLRTDITKALVVMLWCQNIKSGLTVTVLAERGQEIVGYASMHRNEVTWQRHLGELRVQVGPQYRALGLGRTLAAEIFAIAREMGLRKIVAHMTPDQQGAIATVKRYGFEQEALLRDFVIDRVGRTRDLLVMTCDGARLAT